MLQCDDLLCVRGDDDILLWYLCDEHLSGEYQGGNGCSVLNGVDGHLEKELIK